MVTVGLQRHHETNYIETVQRIQDGAIGELNYARVFWNSGGAGQRKERPARMKWSTRHATGSILIGYGRLHCGATYSQY